MLLFTSYIYPWSLSVICKTLAVFEVLGLYLGLPMFEAAALTLSCICDLSVTNLKIYSFSFHMSVFGCMQVYIYVYHICICCLWRLKGPIRFLEIKVTNGCELLCQWWILKLDLFHNNWIIFLGPCNNRKVKFKYTAYMWF